MGLTFAFGSNNPYVTRMILWCIVALVTGCSAGSLEIPLDRAEQSSTRYGLVAAKAIDNDLVTASLTEPGTYSWLKVFFKNTSAVEKVVIEKASGTQISCVYTVTVSGTVCGTYTNIVLG